MFPGRKNQYCENDYITKCNELTQCDPYEITNGIFHRTRTKISQFIWKHKRSQIAKAVPRNRAELEESIFLTSDYTTKLQLSRQYGTDTKTEI